MMIRFRPVGDGRNEEMTSMRSAVLSFAAVLAFAPAALAQEPPAPPKPPEPPAPAAPAPAPAPAAPAKHENRISAEARALFDAYEKTAYSPVALGLKELKGTMVMKMEMPGMEGMEGMEGMPDMSVRFGIDFKAPKTVSIDVKTDNPMLAGNADQMKQGVRSLLLNSMGILEPSDDQEFDADVAVEAGAKTLVLKLYNRNKPMGDLRLTLDAGGLPTKGKMTAVDPDMGMEQTIDIAFQYAKDGDRYRLEKQTITLSMMPEPMEYALTYAPAGDFKVVSSMNMKGPMGMNFAYRFTELSVNGKKVELPSEAKPETKKEELKPAMPVPPVPAPPAGEGGERKEDGR